MWATYPNSLRPARCDWVRCVCPGKLGPKHRRAIRTIRACTCAGAARALAHVLSLASCPVGNVANFVETEQQLTTGSGDMASFVEVRGSIPLLWTQVGQKWGYA